MEGEFTGDPFADEGFRSGPKCQLCERYGHIAKECPTLRGGEKEEKEEEPEEEYPVHLWRLVSAKKRYLTADESGDIKLMKDISPDGWDEWEMHRTEQHDGEPIITLQNNRSKGYLFAYQGHGQKLVCKKDTHLDAPEIYFTMSRTEKKKGLFSSKVTEGRLIKTHHGGYFKAKGKTIQTDGKKPEKDTAMHWHLFEVKVSAQKRKDAHAYSQVFHIPADESDRNPPLPKLLLDHEIVFHLKEKVFSAGGANITGPDDRIWFKVGRLNSLQMQAQDRARYGITNARGEPLVILQEIPEAVGLKYTLARVVKTGLGMKSVPMATIERIELMIKASYQIFLMDGRSIEITGSISDFKTQFKDPITNEVACRIDRHLSLTAGSYSITVAKDEDIMQYLAYAVAIDKMHHDNAQGQGRGGYRGYVAPATSWALGNNLSGTCNACGMSSCRCTYF